MSTQGRKKYVRAYFDPEKWELEKKRIRNQATSMLRPHERHDPVKNKTLTAEPPRAMRVCLTGRPEGDLLIGLGARSPWMPSRYKRSIDGWGWWATVEETDVLPLDAVVIGGDIEKYNVTEFQEEYPELWEKLREEFFREFKAKREVGVTVKAEAPASPSKTKKKDEGVRE